MAKVVAYFTRRTNQLVQFSGPRLATAWKYSKAELGPPSLKDLGEVQNSISSIVTSYKTGAYRKLTVREAWLNTLVTAEVFCWFIAGECIGKGSIIGYNIPGAVNWDMHF
ncbi:ATP synthase subunit g, mitochondrial [Plakobranchus ocellatus]|uniref:ATP synthase subunit g, mitochondrial n=1 Tax=Plakobranchus ocellatus TaxID=259542 RepID=A0AAV3YSY5_9GAST|nr:ATP synthase subunit g, mitochondrial [Plakobranchus ocellatus]